MSEVKLNKSEIKEAWGKAFVDLCRHEFIELYRGFIRVQLISPLEYGEGENKGKISYIDLREPTGDDLDIVDEGKGPLGKAWRLVAACTETPENVVRRIGSRDLARCSVVTQLFLG